MFKYLVRFFLSWPYAVIGFLGSFFGQRKGMNDPIDFVVLWVDGSDEKWLEKKTLCSSRLRPDAPAVGKARFRDWDNFRYWFRAVEKFAPWCRTVYLVSDNQVPQWLNQACPKVRLVRHEEIMPREALPTFNSTAIESCLHNIPGLSEHFVYFNDDVFLTRPVSKKDFFQGGKPLLCSSGTIIRVDLGTKLFSHQQFTTVGTVSSKDWVSWMWRHPFKWFSHQNGIGLIHNVQCFQHGYMGGIFTPHMATPMRKSTYELAWEWFPEALSETVSHQFRQYNDTYQQLFTLVDMYRGDFVPCSRSHFGRYFLLNLSDKSVDDFCASLPQHAYVCSCLNDTDLVTEDSFPIIKQRIIDAFEKEFPAKSQFEI